MKKIIKKIFNRTELKENPPVLIDIGASHSIHAKWSKIAKYSICIAFDADERDFNYITEENKRYKKLYIFNCIVSNQDSDSMKFYLTESPYCSSILEPEIEKLKSTSHANLFTIVNTKRIKSVSLKSVLSEIGIGNVDWFKSDAQGIDLRLFKNLNDKIQNNILVAEFEPGFIDAYKNEDKVKDVLDYMGYKNFWISEFIPRGVPKIPFDLIQRKFNNNYFRNKLRLTLKPAPGWASITYFNSFENSDNFGLREYIVGWLFASLEGHHSFALTIAHNGIQLFNDDLLKELENYSIRKVKKEIIFNSLTRKIKRYLSKILL